MKIIDITGNKNISHAINDTIKCLEKGDIFIYPTDTIYGIGCDIYNRNALEKIMRVKKRNENKQFIILIHSLEMLEKIAIVTDDAHDLINKYWPGSLTLIFHAKNKMEEPVCGEENKIAIRMPDNDFCLELIRQYNNPIISTSANIHSIEQGDFNSIVETFKDEIDLFIFNGEVKSNLPSTIVDVTSGERIILRKGIIHL